MKRKVTVKRTAKRKPRCARCRINAPMPPDLYRERLEDIPDGPMLCLPQPLCEECLDWFGDEVESMMEEG